MSKLGGRHGEKEAGLEKGPGGHNVIPIDLKYNEEGGESAGIIGLGGGGRGEVNKKCLFFRCEMER